MRWVDYRFLKILRLKTVSQQIQSTPKIMTNLSRSSTE
jgi:hypothetical protein